MSDTYAGLDQLTDRLGQTAAGDTAILQQALEWATSWIDDYCHRSFQNFADTRRYDAGALNAENKRILDLDEDLLAVETLLNGDGTTITTDQYVLEPRNERPYYQIRLLSTAWWVFPVDGLVTVGGDWGYSLDPSPLVVGACLSLAEYFYRSRRLADVVTLTSATTGTPATPKQYAFPDHVTSDLAALVKLAR